MSVDNNKQFITLLSESFTNKTFVKLSLMNKRNKTNELKTVSAKLIVVKEGTKLSFIYRYPTKDITKNFNIEECVDLIDKLLENDFFQADLFTLEADYYLTINHKNTASIRKKKHLLKKFRKLHMIKRKTDLLLQITMFI